MDINEINKDVINLIKGNSYKTFKNGVVLKQNQIDVLEKYNIDYQSVNSMQELIYLIEDVLEETYYPEDLDNVSLELSEFNYYNNTNK